MGNAANNNPAYNAVRQIATELIMSINIFNKGKYIRKKQENRLFEMRYFDEERKFKWSTTELNYSDETFKIVNQYKKENRILYLQEYSDGTKIEVVGR